eukprot:scaffold1448_cov387-Prasinococcus_capsulatus_cf.AAC.3
MSVSATAGGLIGLRLLGTTMRLDDSHKTGAKASQDSFLERRQTLIATVQSTPILLAYAYQFPILLHPDFFFDSSNSLVRPDEVWCRWIAPPHSRDSVMASIS